MNKLTKNMELAEAQILGFNHAVHGYSMSDLVSSMGLNRAEWEIIKDKMPVLDYLPKELVDEIEDYLKESND